MHIRFVRKPCLDAKEAWERWEEELQDYWRELVQASPQVPGEKVSFHKHTQMSSPRHCGLTSCGFPATASRKRKRSQKPKTYSGAGRNLHGKSGPLHENLMSTIIRPMNSAE